MSFEFYSVGGGGRRDERSLLLSFTKRYKENLSKSVKKKKKDAFYANGSGPDPPSSSDTSVTSPAFIDVFLPVRAARISSFPRALLPYLHYPNSNPFRFLSFEGDKIAGEELLDFRRTDRSKHRRLATLTIISMNERIDCTYG